MPTGCNRSTAKRVDALTTAANDMREKILAAAGDLLRRHGPAKTGVVDVARACGMSHANVYRHFSSKAALLDAVAGRWLAAIVAPLEAIVEAGGPAPARLEAWLLALAEAKRRKVLDDPELFETYQGLVSAMRHVVAEHVGHLQAQVAAIVAQGVARGDYRVADPQAAAAAVLAATAVFHTPRHVKARGGASARDEARRVIALVNAGLAAGVV